MAAGWPCTARVVRSASLAPSPGPALAWRRGAGGAVPVLRCAAGAAALAGAATPPPARARPGDHPSPGTGRIAHPSVTSA